MPNSASAEKPQPKILVKDFIAQTRKGVQIVLDHLEGRNFPPFKSLTIEVKYENTTEVGVELLVVNLGREQVVVKTRKVVLGPREVAPTPVIIAAHVADSPDIPTSYEADNEQKENLTLVPFYLELASELTRAVAEVILSESNDDMSVQEFTFARDIIVTKKGGINLSFNILKKDEENGGASISASAKGAVAQSIVVQFAKAD